MQCRALNYVWSVLDMNANLLIFILYTLIVWFAAPNMVIPGIALCGFVLSIPAWFVLAFVKGSRIS